MQKDDMSAALESAVDEIAHPFGSVAFLEPIKRRAALPARDIVAYGDGDQSAANKNAAAAKKKAARPNTSAAMPDVGNSQVATIPVPSETSDSAAAATGEASAKRKKPGDKGKLPHIVRSVRLPNWMDLDQESMPNGGQPVAVVDTRRQTESKALDKPMVLDDFGGVGELTVQLRTSRTAETTSFDEMLSGFAARKEVEAQRKKVPPGSTYVCHRCKVPGHWVQDCPQAVGSAPPPAGYLCHVCRIPGHWLEDCPGKSQAKLKCKVARAAGGEVEDGEVEEGEMEEGEMEEEGARGRAKRPKHAAVDGKGGEKRYGAPPEGYVCNACHSTGHWLEQCPRLGEYRKGAPPAGYVCVKCNQAGHWVHNCTSAPKGGWKENSAADGRSQEVETLVVGPEAREIGEDIAEALEEDLPEVVQLLQRAVQAVGEATSRQLLVQTWQVEASGGLLTTDGTNRRRTPGGVFFWLVKQKASAEDRARIFAAK